MPLEEALVLDDVADDELGCARRTQRGRRSSCAPRTSDAVAAALARPEVSCVLVPPEQRELRDLDLRRRSMARAAGRRTRSSPAILAARQWGVAVQSKFPAVGAVVPWAEAEVGAVATQALANVSYGPSGLELLREGLAAAEVVERLTEAGRGARAPPARRRRPRRAEQRRTPARTASNGPAESPARATPRRGTSSSRRRRFARSPRRSRRAPGGRSRSGCWQRSRRHRPRAATGAASSRRRSTS